MAENRPTKYIFEKGHIVPSWEELEDPDVAAELFRKRLETCLACELIEQTQNGSYKCKECGCYLKYRIETIYPLDIEEKAFRQIKLDGTRIYVCPLKKW